MFRRCKPLLVTGLTIEEMIIGVITLFAFYPSARPLPTPVEIVIGAG
jgi:hypothetical protein